MPLRARVPHELAFSLAVAQDRQRAELPRVLITNGNHDIKLLFSEK
jgi:hypothetical protein